DVEYVSYGEGVTPPILEEREGYQFVGFSENLEKITTSLKVYPVYIEVGNILVRFYKNEISQENFLYSESIPIGSSLTFHWSIPHYTVKSISESLEHIKNSMDVVVTYEPVLKYYYVDEELYETVYYDEEDPVAPSILNIRPGYWKQREDDPYSFDLFCYSNGYSCFINYEGTIEEVFYSAFLQYGAAYYLAIRDKTYQFYEWYYDKNFTKRITDFSSILNCAWIYGKKVDSYEEEYTIFDYKLEEDGYHMSYNWEYLLSEFPLVNIPETHEGYPVVSVDAVIIQMSRYVFIPKTIVRIDGSITSLTLFNTKYFFVSEENPVFIAQYWLEDRNMLLKVCDDKQIITGFYGSYNDGLNEIHLKKNMEFDWNLLSNSPIERLYLDEGVESFSLFFGHIRELYVSSTVQKIIDIVFAPDPISEYKLNQVIFSEDCHLESIPARLCNTEIPFIMPNSVKIIEGGASYRSQPYNFILPENHPYLKIENNLILSRDGTILVGLYSYSNTPLLEPPSTVTKFYYSFFQGLVELGYNEIQYPKDIVYTLTCNGVTCEVTKLIEDALYYYRFVNKKIFINENGDPILRLNMKFDTDL
ncbi:MAG: hypothetical protein K2J85_04030, partial [Anaeroplasmataceae bacterium]|nr:hypothetical protein [Anaeroplasmataceae bacterium]